MRRLFSGTLPWMLVVSLTACASSGSDLAVEGDPSPSTSPSPTPAAPPSPTTTPPSPDVRPFPERLAGRMATVHTDLMDLVDIWIEDARGKPRGAKFHQLEVLGLRKQKMIRELVAHPRLFRRVVKYLPTGLRLETLRNFKAARQLYELTPPVKRSSFRMPTSREDPPKKLLRAYAEAQDRFGVPWSLLAAVNLIESRMGRLNGPSSSGALGPMQFMPATWDAYGKGSPFNPHNAIIAAARYLAANGAPSDLRNAVWHYNHSDYYVNAVITYHRHIAAHPKSYYSYYFWQAFARTTKGDLQLTGPGNTYPY